MSCRHALTERARASRGIVALLIGIAALTALAIPAAADAKAKNVTAMTRNLYLGANLEAAILAPNVPATEAAAGVVYETMLASDFPARAKLIAKEIKKAKPDFVGLQEVTRWLRGPKNDPAAAETVVVDFLRELRKRLRKLDLKYVVAVKQKNVDVEVPTDHDLDLRLIDWDALLVKKSKKIKVQATDGANYPTMLTVPIAGGALGTVDVPRGYVEANLKVRGKKLHVVNTHLEAFLSAIRDAQADELLAAGGPLDSKRRTILVGDLNSAPGGTTQGDSEYAYDAIVADGFADRGVEKPTCCFDADLLGGELYTRIDHVLVKPGAKSKKSSRSGAGSKPLTKAGQHPSDHAGVWSQLRIK